MKLLVADTSHGATSIVHAPRDYFGLSHVEYTIDTLRYQAYTNTWIAELSRRQNEFIASALKIPKERLLRGQFSYSYR